MTTEQGTVSAIEPTVSPERRWTEELRGRVRRAGDEIRQYQGEPSFSNAVGVLTALTETGSEALVDVPDGVSEQTTEQARRGFVSVHNRATEALIPDMWERRQFELPTEPFDDTENWQRQIRFHFSKAGEIGRAFQAGQTPTAEEVIKLGLHLSMMGGLAIARVPKGQEAQAYAYAGKYRDAGRMLVELLRAEVKKRETGETQEVEPVGRVLTVRDVLETMATPGMARRIEGGVETFEQVAGAINDEYGERVGQLRRKSLTFLDRIAEVMVDPKSGKQKGFLLQTGLDFLGIPSVISVGDVMGALRGYLNMRSGHPVKGAAEMITALAPGIPTGPTHWLIEKIWPDEEYDKRIPKKLPDPLTGK